MPDEERAVMTDEDAADRRRARFGELPPRVLPQDLMELVATNVRRCDPEPTPLDVLWFGYYNP